MSEVQQRSFDPSIQNKGKKRSGEKETDGKKAMEKRKERTD